VPLLDTPIKQGIGGKAPKDGFPESFREAKPLEGGRVGRRRQVNDSCLVVDSIGVQL